MCRLKMLIKSISKQGLKFKLVFFQLVIVFISLNFAFTLINKNLEIKNNINKLVSKDNSVMFRLSVSSQNQDPLNSINKIYEEISNNKMVDKIGSYFMSKIKVNDSEINAIFFNRGAFDLYNMNICKGSNKIFNYQKSQDEIPIFISNNLSNKLNVGNVITVKMLQDNQLKDFKLKVIGMLSSDTVFWNSKLGGNSSIVSLKDSIIIPFDKQYFYDEIVDSTMKSKHTVVSIKKTHDLNEFTTYFSKINYNNTTLDYIKINDLITQIYNINKPWIMMTLTFSLLLSILSTIGFIGILTSYITFRKREYGIRFALGSSNKELTRLICGEIYLSLITTNFISILILIIINYILKMNLTPLLIVKSIIPSFIISVTMFFITFLTFKSYILKKNIVDLMRGN
ncbi:ABC transporter permease [Clostridium tetani]|uniref:ABC transporter permease n=1 Tax=Clostridium tetani TaxID=1513 RepID=A0A4Q0VA41_CLOTA|nr:FtsX-like permease family protein [Clostridium tetani]RXI44166.1 ABC transporter permease [Clostridium tetani]